MSLGLTFTNIETIRISRTPAGGIQWHGLQTPRHELAHLIRRTPLLIMTAQCSDGHRYAWSFTLDSTAEEQKQAITQWFRTRKTEPPMLAADDLSAKQETWTL
jgi:hypothetical protein